MMEYRSFQINQEDNVATALCEIPEGQESKLIGEAAEDGIVAAENIPMGHKISLKDIRKDENIVKYGVVIGRATKDIKAGSWVHLHDMCSNFDERSSHLDAVTGAPKDTRYV